MREIMQFFQPYCPFKYLTKTQLRAFWIVEREIQINETEQWNTYFITKNLKKNTNFPS